MSISKSILAAMSLILSAAATAWGAAPMRWDPVPSPDFAAGMARDTLMNHTIGAPADPGAAGGTHYQPSPQVSEMIRAQFIDRIKQGLSPDDSRKTANAFASHDPLELWARAMAESGLQPNDVADAVASYWTLNWAMANHGDVSPTEAVGVRNQIERVMLSGPLVQLADAGRQEVAETAIMEFVMLSSAYVGAIRQNDEADMDKLSDAAEQRFLTEDKIDLRQLVITEDGFSYKP